MHLRKIMLLLLLWLAFGSHATGQEFAPIEPEGPEKPELWVDFSIEGGFYNQDLRIELSSPGAQIYYTTDGNTPDPRVGSHKYTGPIDVSTTSKNPANAFSLSGKPNMNATAPAIQRRVLLKRMLYGSCAE